MKILILEDIDYRQNFLKELFPNDEIDCTKKAEEGLDLLRNNDYDIVFLDHDIIGAKSGSYMTMQWAQQYKDFKTQKPFVIIHSMNMEGAAKMEAHLKGISKKTERVNFKLIVQKQVDVVELISS